MFNRLQKLQICLSHKSTLMFLDEAAEGYDEKVWDWRDTLLERIADRHTDVAQVSILITIWA